MREIKRRGTDNITKKKIDIEMHPTVYNMLFKEQSNFLEEIEKQHNIEITFQVNPKLHLEKYKVVAS
jgi:ribonuclease G